MKEHKIEHLTDREHIQRRPSMYIGGITAEPMDEYVLGEYLEIKTLTYPPGLVKIINEVIDNAIDAIVKTKQGNTVSVSFNNGEVKVEDNSAGFPVATSDIEPMILALGNARAGSNFNDAENVGQMGTNGVGAFATNCFSEYFECTTTSQTARGLRTVKALWQDGLLKGQVAKEHKTGKTGTVVTFKPDLSKFKLKEFPEDAKTAIATRLACLAYCYPKIKFVLNSEQVKAPKDISEWFNIEDEPQVTYKTDNYEVKVVARSETTKHFSFVNGLNIKDGGTHLDVILNDISKSLQEARGVNASKADVLNTLQLIFVGLNFKNLRFSSQTKEKITNSTAEVREYLGDIKGLVDKVQKSKAIKDFIRATAKARETRAEASKLKSVKRQKIKSDKFLDAQQQRKILMLVEGDSALGGLLPALGRSTIAYYALKGKPLNAWSVSGAKLASNKELSELLSIVHNSDLERLVFATDQDLDGFHIRGLLLGFVYKYLPEMRDKVYFLNTPVRGVFKNDKLQRWSFNLSDDLKLKAGEDTKYFKGLGSWDAQELRQVLQAEGLEKVMEHIEIEDIQTMENWLGADSEPRKEYILANDFDIAKI